MVEPVKFSAWLEEETLGELAGLLDDQGRALLERVFEAGKEAADTYAAAEIEESRRETAILALRLERVIDKTLDQELWCTPELHTHIMQAAMGKDGAE